MVICRQPSYWFNCLFPSLPCLFICLWASDFAHLMNTDPKQHSPQLPLSLNTSIISLCLMSGTIQGWQVGKIPLLRLFLQSVHDYDIYWPAIGCVGSVQIYAKKLSQLCNDCQLNHPLCLDPWGQLEPLSYCTCRDCKAVTLPWNWMKVLQVRMCEQ